MKIKLLDVNLLKTWLQADNRTNLKHLIVDYLTLGLILISAVVFFEWRAAWGLSWIWCIPVSLLVIVLVGAVQHRLACLAHEAAHYTLLKNRLWNELVSDLFCLFPLFGTTQNYRLHHVGHHLYPNDWEKDPNLLNGGKTKLFDKFPMDRRHFIYSYYLRFFWPPFLMRHLWDIFYVSSLGSGIAPVPTDHDRENPEKLILRVRPATILGMVYFAALVGSLIYANQTGNHTLLFSIPALFLPVATGVVLLLPEKAFFQAPVQSPYSTRFSSLLRLFYYSTLLFAIAWGRALTGIPIGLYVWIFWLLPVFTTFPYFMLLREIYQHANTDGGDLTNSRIFFTDPFTRWAIFMYGQDIHLVHHLYPNVPHYRLLKLHRELQQKSPEYAEKVVECHGTFKGQGEHPSIVEVMAPTPRSEN